MVFLFNMLSNLFLSNREAVVRAKRACTHALAIVVSITLLGCSAAYNARSYWAPDGRHSVNCYIRGAFGRNYYAETNKKLIVTIYAHGPNDKILIEKDGHEAEVAGVWVSHTIPGIETKLVFTREYRMKGSSVEWLPTWREPDELSIMFYDHGRNVTSEGTSRRLLRTINYRFDVIEGTYKEY